MAEDRKLAIVTGASSGIGLELVRLAAQDGCDLVIASDEAEIHTVADRLREDGASVEPVRADLGTRHGLDALWDAIADRHIDYLMANAGRGLGHAFLEQDPDAIEAVIHVNVTGTTSLLHHAIPEMRAAGEGRILITGSLAGHVPGSFQAVYNGTKAYLDTLSWGLREELRGTGVTVTCLMPGPTDTAFFATAGMQDTPVGESGIQGRSRHGRAGRLQGDASRCLGCHPRLHEQGAVGTFGRDTGRRACPHASRHGRTRWRIA